jgi:chromosome segregation ATPase
VAELKGTVAELTAAKTEVEEQLHGSQAEVAELKGTVAELEAARSEVEEQLHGSQAEVAELKGNVAELEAAKSEVEEQLHGSQAEVAESKGNVAELEAAKSELEGQLHESQAEVAELKGVVHEREAQLDEERTGRKKDRAAFAKKEEELNGTLQELGTNVAELKGTVEEMKETHASEIQAWSEKLEDMTRGLDFMEVVSEFDYTGALSAVGESQGQVAELLKADSGDAQDTLTMILSELEGIQEELSLNQKEYGRRIDQMYKDQAGIHEVFGLIEIIDGNRILMERYQFVTNLLT